MPDLSAQSLSGFGDSGNAASQTQPSSVASGFGTPINYGGVRMPTYNASNINNQLSNTVQAMMRGYLRRDDTGGYLPLTSSAPDNFLGSFTPLDRYRSFGVPSTGIPETTPYGSGQESQYAALFSSPGGGGGY